MIVTAIFWNKRGGFSESIMITKSVYSINKFAVIEDFVDESLAFIPGDRRMVRINSVNRNLLKYLDGKTTLNSIAAILSENYDISKDLLLEDFSKALQDLEQTGLVRNQRSLDVIYASEAMTDKTYLINRDISCRIEEPDGALLFNPATDAVKVINPVGLEIWQALEYPRTMGEVVECLLNLFDDVPIEQISNDVQEFIESLVKDGFIGEVID